MSEIDEPIGTSAPSCSLGSWCSPPQGLRVRNDEMAVETGLPRASAELPREPLRTRRASTQSAKSRILPRSPKSVSRIKNFPPATSTSIDLRRITIGQRLALESLLFIDQHAKDDAARRSGTLIHPHQRLEPPIARFDAVSQQGSALRADSAVKRLASKLEQMAVDRPIHPELAGRADIRKIASAGPVFARSDKRTTDFSTCTLTSSLNGKRTFAAEPGRRLDVAFVNPGIGRTEPRAVVQRELQESRLGPRIVDQRPDRSRPQRSAIRSISRGLPSHSSLSSPVIPQEIAREPVAVREPHHFLLARLEAHPIPHRVELVAVTAARP